VAILASGIAVLASFALGAVVVDLLDAELADVSHKIAARRVAMRLGDGPGANSAQRALTQRKQATPSSVLVLEALSKILPDHTYVTELHIEGDRLQVVGITRDAPSLIELIEQSAQFTRATFFAPTTQAPGDPGERFHIEARIKAEFAQGS
jgi:general secretion pathway protein L